MGQLNSNNQHRRARPAEEAPAPSKRAPALGPLLAARTTAAPVAPTTPALETPFRARALAFACGLDAVLGASSPVRALTADLAQTVLALAAPPRVVTASQDGTARVWDLETGACAAVCRGHRGGVLCVATAAGRIYTGGVDTKVRVWDAATGTCLRVLSDSRHHVMALCIVPSRSGFDDEEGGMVDKEKEEEEGGGGGALVCGSKDGHLRVYGLEDGVLRATVATAGAVCSLVHDAAAHTVVAGLANGTLVRYDTRTWTPRGTPLNAHSSVVIALRMGLEIPVPPEAVAGEAAAAEGAAAAGEQAAETRKPRTRRTLVSLSNTMLTTIGVWDADTGAAVARVEDREATVTDVQMVVRTHTARRPVLVASTGHGAVLEYDALTGSRTRIVVPPLRTIPVRCLLVLPDRNIDLGTAWYSTSSSSTSSSETAGAGTATAITAVAAAPMTEQSIAEMEEFAAERAEAAREHDEDEAAACAGRAGAGRAARALVAGLLSGTCSVCDYPRGDRVLALPAPPHGGAHTDAVNAVAVLERRSPHRLG